MSDDDIPTLTTIVRRRRESRPSDEQLGELEDRLITASLDLADRLIHSAVRDMEAALLEQVSDRLRAELPDLIAGVLRDQFRDSEPTTDD